MSRFDPLWRTPLFAQKPCQQSPCRLCVPVDLQDFVEHISFLINGAPEIAFLAIDGDNDLVEMPNVVVAWYPSLEAAGVVGAEFDRPPSDRFAGDDNAVPKRHFLDQARAQWETEIEPDCARDEFQEEIGDARN